MQTLSLIGLLCAGLLGLASPQDGNVVDTAADAGAGTERVRSARSAVAIAAVNSTQHSGAFIALHNGNIAFHEALEPATRPVDVSLRQVQLRSLNPTGMVYRDPLLYLYDSNAGRITTLQLAENRVERRERLQGQLIAPRLLAASPNGLLATIDQQNLVILQQDRPPTTYDKRFFNVAGLAFSSWNTLHVLGREAVTTVELARRSDGSIEFVAESPQRLPPPQGQQWEALDVFDGILYLATREQVYARVDDRLIPLLPRSLKLDSIRDIGMTRNGVYLLDGTHVKLVPRPDIVTLTFEMQPAAANAAALDFYAYLQQHDLLSLAPLQATRSYASPLELLAEQGLVPADSAGPELSAHASAVWREGAAAALPNDSASGIASGEQLEVPQVHVNREISREHIVLDQSLREKLDERITTPALRRQIGPDLIRRLNPELAVMSDDALLSLRSGAVVLPVETWSITLATPAGHYDDRKSPLWQLLARHHGLSVEPTFAFSRQSGESIQDDGTTAAAAASADAAQAFCDELKAARKGWFELIGSWDERINEHADLALNSGLALIGVIEYAATIAKTHLAFHAPSGRPVWHVLSNLGVVEPDPAAAASDSSDYRRDRFTTERDHGTHVAALMAGRPGSCWSGLAAGAKLVAIDAGDQNGIVRQIRRAASDGVRVFNGSLSFRDMPDRTAEQFLQTLQDKDVLLVAASGNDAVDLEQAATVFAPVRWGDSGNVVVVAASDSKGLLWQPAASSASKGGANFGSRYVDLIAPGENLFSALHDGAFGVATGTSQAAPQVSAAAAILATTYNLSSREVKARLLATAAWDNAYQGKVWGGRLAFSAATEFPHYHVLRTYSDAAAGIRNVFEPANNPLIEVLSASGTYERGAAVGSDAPVTVPFAHILSLRRYGVGDSAVYRIVYKDDSDKLRILLDAEIEGAADASGVPQRLQCSMFRRFDESSGQLVDSSGCSGGIAINKIDSYFRSSPYYVSNWRSP